MWDLVLNKRIFSILLMRRINLGLYFAMLLMIDGIIGGSDSLYYINFWGWQFLFIQVYDILFGFWFWFVWLFRRIMI